MADTPYTIRMSEDVKARFNELAEMSDVDNKGDFLDRLLIMYQSETAKKDVDEMKPAIEAVETLTCRLLEVLSGTAATIMTKDEKYREELHKVRQSSDETRTLMQQRITVLEDERTEDEERIRSCIDSRDAAEARAVELQQKIDQMDSALQDKTALIEEYKAKNDALNSTAAEHEDSAEQIKNLNGLIETYQAKEKQQQQRIDELEKTAEHQGREYETEKKTALLELKETHQAEAKKIQDEHNAKVAGYQEQIDQLLKSKDEMQNTIAELKSKPATTRTRKAKESDGE